MSSSVLDEEQFEPSKKKGPNFKPTEDTELCKAFVAASEDAVVGTNQKGDVFQKKIWHKYCQLIKNYNQNYKASLEYRTPKSCFNRFKRLSKLALKMIGIKNVQPKKSGDNGEECERLCKKAFCDRNDKDKGLVDTVWNCVIFLEDKPKWKSWQMNEKDDDDEKTPRPIGNKKAKQLAEDRKLLESIVSAGEKTKEAVEEAKHKEKTALISELRSSMSKVGNSMDLMVAGTCCCLLASPIKS